MDTIPVPAKSPDAIPAMTYLYAVAIAMWGGLVSYRAKVVARNPQTWSMMELIGEVSTAAFAGVLVFWGCQHLETPPFLTAITVGIAGHMGGRSIQLLEETLKRKAGGQ